LRARLPDMPRWKLVAAVAGVVLLAVAGAGLAVLLGDDGESAPVSRTATGQGASTPARTATQPKPRKRPRVARSVAALARRMPLERKVAALFLLGFQGQDLNAPIFQRLRQLDLGGIVVDEPNYTSPEQLSALAGEAVVIARQERHVRPWVMAPQEGGTANAFRDLPPATVAAELRSAAHAFREADLAARTLGGLRVTGVLGPVGDVAPPEGVALGARAYSDDPAEVAQYVTAVVDAYRRVRVLSAVGHFPGLGSGSEDTRLGPSQIGSRLDDLRARDLVPFRAAIAAGVPAVLVGHGLYVTDDFVVPASLSRAVTTGLLRRELRFEGIAITDDLADPPITALTSIPDAAVRALKAGADLLYVSGPPLEQEAAYDAVVKAVRRGDIGRARIEEALLRNLSVKRDYGLVK
jgi:beta-N-acetylhexosaminidase